MVPWSNPAAAALKRNGARGIEKEGEPYGWLERISLSMGFTKLTLEERSRRLMALLMVFLSVPALFGFSIYHLSYGVLTSGLALLPLAVSMAFLPFQLRTARDAKNVYRVNLALAGLMLVYVFYVSPPFGHEALWLNVYPVSCFFLLGKKEGLIVSLLLFLLSMAVFAWFDLYLGLLHYHRSFLARFSLVYLMLCGCSYSYESVRTMFRKGMEQKQEELTREKEKLDRSKKAVEAASAAKSEFLANMSHELRTPLNHVIGFTQLLMDQRVGETNEQQKEYLRYVLESGNQLLSLISDILDLTDMEAGKLRLERSEVNIRSLLEKSLLRIRQEALRRYIRCTQDLQDLPPATLADERKLRQVMHHLLSNAVKFTQEGGAIHLTARQKTPAGGRPSGSPGSGSRRTSDFIEISVSDTGIGIDPESLERIFQPFEHLESPSGRKYKGSGVGLSLTRSFVELHGGKIWAESEGEGRGSTFRVVFPVSNGPKTRFDRREDVECSLQKAPTFERKG